ncbi:hypothetical protein TKK_0003312 [Trichogramma kaykai]
METSGLFNPVVRVKVEPCDDLLTQNNYEPIDEISVTENVKYERFLQENSIREACQIFAYITHACETCGKTFGHKRNLKDHQIAHHPRISAK